MWDWLLNFLGLKSKTKNELPCFSTVIPLSNSEIETVPPVKYDLYLALAKARQEALEPVLPEKFKEAVSQIVNGVVPLKFKKHLISREDLILISNSDLRDYRSDISEKFSDEEWHVIKTFAIKELNENGIDAGSSTGGDFIKCHVANILAAIKDYKIPEEEKEISPMNSVGIYR